MQLEARLRVGVTVGAGALALLHVVRPTLNIDAITVALLVVAAIPWLQPIFKSIQLPGGWKFELQELKRGLEEAAGTASSAEKKADYAISGGAPVAAISDQPSSAISSADTLINLVAEYDHIRRTQTSGNARTQAMTRVVRKMIELAPSLPGFDLDTNLLSDDPGWRLSAYAFLYANPDPKACENLTFSVTQKEDKPFGQYWGLQAIGRVLAACKPSEIPSAVKLYLRNYGEKVQRGTDRDHEVRKLLRDLGGA